MIVMPRVKVLALTHRNLSVDVVMNFLKCFPYLEKLCIWVTILTQGLSVYFALTLFSRRSRNHTFHLHAAPIVFKIVSSERVSQRQLSWIYD
jgi:hypothetical protein